jgi:hypothetical protein
MTRQEFIFTLFDNGSGLSFEQIAEIENGLIDTIPSGTIEGLQDINGMSREDATATALMTAYDVFMDSMRDCTDMLELKRFIDSTICNTRLNTSDMQVYRLWYVVRD